MNEIGFTKHHPHQRLSRPQWRPFSVSLTAPRPPAEHRFKPGRSGNPKGRPKGSRNIASIVAEVLARRIRTKIDGETQRILPTEALVHVVLRKALNGDRHAWETVFRWIEQAETSKERRDAVRSFSEKEEAILRRMQERFASGGDR